MGGCASKPAAEVEPVTAQHRAPASREANPQADLTPPIMKDAEATNLQVAVNDQNSVMKLGRTASGRVVVEVQRNEQLDIAKVDAAVGSSADSPEFQALKVLEKMGLGLQFSPGDPFIGQLVLEVVEVTGLTAQAPRPYLVVSGEDDKSSPKEPAAVEGDTIRFEGAKFVFFVVFSNGSFDIALKARRGPSKTTVGRAILQVSHLKQGSERGELDLLNDKGAKVGSVKVDVDYRWLRGTRDDGTYTVVNRLILNKARRMRKTLRVGLAAIEMMSQVNHWILSHDNVWRVRGELGAALPSKEEVEAEQAVAAVETEEDREARDTLAAVEAQQELRLPDGDAATQLQCALHGTTERKTTGSQMMAQALMLEMLGRKEGDSADVAQLKQAVLVVMAPMLERMADMEARMAALTEAVQCQQLQVEAANAAADGPAPPPAATAAASAAAATPADGSTGSDALAESSQVMPFISGHFEYGMGRSASNRTVFVFMRKAHLAGSPVMHPEFLGTHKTKRNGNLGPIPLPPTICRTPGHYEIVGMLPDDMTSAKGSMFVLQPGTKAVVFDMDGTITVGDSQVVTQFGLDALGASTALNSQLSHRYDLRPRRHALHVVRAWAAKGYQPIYLSGRQGSYFNLTQAWLIKHRYPPGPIHLTRTHMPTLPVYFSVGLFKVKYMESLKEKGIQIYAAYGNTPTDIKAYEAAGVPKERTFILGPHGGKGGTVKVPDFTDHMLHILEHPDANVPIPYTELLISERPGYRKKKKVKGPDGVTREVSSVTSVGVAMTDLGLSEEEEEERAQHLDDFEDEDAPPAVGE